MRLSPGLLKALPQPNNAPFEQDNTKNHDLGPRLNLASAGVTMGWAMGLVEDMDQAPMVFIYSCGWPSALRLPHRYTRIEQ